MAHLQLTFNFNVSFFGVCPQRRLKIAGGVCHTERIDAGVGDLILFALGGSLLSRRAAGKLERIERIKCLR